MRLLHILKSEPDQKTKILMDIVSEGEENTVFPLYEKEVDYGKLLDLIFQNDKVISWW